MTDDIKMPPQASNGPMPNAKDMTEAEWRDRLTPEEYHVLREHGTERAFTGAYNDEKRPGVYSCRACEAPLFKADAKYDSGSGWPSFFAAIDPNAITEITDTSHGMTRIEIRCANCDSHLGHVFPDGPGPDGLRYCTNSLSLDFKPNVE